MILIRELKSLGLLETTVDRSGLPNLEDMEADGSYLTWQFALTTSAALDDIRDVFEFVLDDCNLSIEEEAGSERSQIEEESSGKHETAEPAETGEMPAAPPPKRTAPAGGAIGKAAADKKPPASIRVDLERIDRLVNMVGELVITQAMLSEQIGQLSVNERASLLHGVETLALQMRELQDNVMSIRAQPVKSVFSRMTRPGTGALLFAQQGSKAGHYRRDDRSRQDGDRGTLRPVDAYDP